MNEHGNTNFDCTRSCSFHIIGNHFMPNNIPISNIYGTQLLPAYITESKAPTQELSDEGLETIFFEAEDDEVYYLLEQQNKPNQEPVQEEEFKNTTQKEHFVFRVKTERLLNTGIIRLKFRYLKTALLCFQAKTVLFPSSFLKKGSGQASVQNQADFSHSFYHPSATTRT